MTHGHTPGREALPAVGRPPGQGGGGSCVPTTAQGRRRRFLLLQKVGPFAVCPGEEADSACVLHPPLRMAGDPASPPPGLLGLLCRQLPLFGFEAEGEEKVRWL